MYMQWNQTAQRFFKTGLSHGVLKVESEPQPVAWSGLTSVSDEPDGGEHTPLYFEGIKTLDHVANTNTKLLLECVAYPEEFELCDGKDGIFTNQRRERFHLSYRTKIGNDVDGTEHGYELHLVYNCTALPTKKMMQTLAQQTTLSTFSWTIHAVPLVYGLHRPTAHIILNSITQPEAVAAIEEILYGSEGEDPVFPVFPEYEDVVDVVDTSDAPEGTQVDFAVSDTWVVPDGVFLLDRILLVGPGAPAGRSTRGGGGGGGGDVVVLSDIPVTPGETITVELGTPATPPVDANTHQATPGESSIMVGSVSGTIAEAIAGGNGGGADNDTSAQTGACGGGGAGGTSGNQNLGAPGITGGDGGTGRGTVITNTRAGGGGGGMAPENGTTATSANSPGIGGDGLDVSAIFGPVGGAAGVFGGGGGGGSTSAAAEGGLGGAGGGGQGGGSNHGGIGQDAVANTGGGGGGNGSTASLQTGAGGTGFASIKWHVE